MADFNPYQAPLDDAAVVMPVDSKYPGLWRDGTVLVMARGAKLPPRCIKSNEAADPVPLGRSLSWHHPAISLTILLSLLIYIVLALVMSKKAKIDIWLSSEWKARRKKRMLIAWLMVGVAVVSGFVGIVLVSDRAEIGGPLLLFGGVLFLVGAISGLLGSRMVAPTRITDSHIWLKGVHPEFLADLPQLPAQ